MSFLFSFGFLIVRLSVPMVSIGTFFLYVIRLRFRTVIGILGTLFEIKSLNEFIPRNRGGP